MKLFLIFIFCCCNILVGMDNNADAQTQYLINKHGLKGKLEALIDAIPEQRSDEQSLHAVMERMQLRVFAMQLLLLPDNIKEVNKEEAVTLFKTHIDQPPALEF
jgi:hypothetical protein